MITEAENAFIALVKDAPVGDKLRLVESLPDLEGENLVKRFGADAPAVYVVAASFPVKDRAARLRFGLVCVARNSRGHAAARQGDGKLIGLYEIMETVAGLIDGAIIAGGSWRVTSGDFVVDEKLYQAGVYAGVVQAEMDGECTLPNPLDTAALALFKTFRASYDIDPHESAAEHVKWAGDPPDHTTSAPEVSETVTIQP